MNKENSSSLSQWGYKRILLSWTFWKPTSVFAALSSFALWLRNLIGPYLHSSLRFLLSSSSSRVLTIACVFSVSPCRLSFIYHRGRQPSFIFFVFSLFSRFNYAFAKRSPVCSCTDGWLWCIFHHLPHYCIISIPLPQPIQALLPEQWPSKPKLMLSQLELYVCSPKLSSFPFESIYFLGSVFPSEKVLLSKKIQGMAAFVTQHNALFWL